MNKPLLAICLLALSAPSWAAVTPCDAIQDKINKKLAGKNVTNYTLDVVDKSTETSDRVVGTCDGGKKKIIYKKTKAKKDAA